MKIPSADINVITDHAYTEEYARPDQTAMPLHQLSFALLHTHGQMIEVDSDVRPAYLIRQSNNRSCLIDGKTVTLDTLFEKVLSVYGRDSRKGYFVLSSLKPLTMVWMDPATTVEGTPIEVQDRRHWLKGHTLIHLKNLRHRVTSSKYESQSFTKSCVIPGDRTYIDCEHELVVTTVDYSQYRHVKIVFDD
ncbi:MAG: hypothetical protein ACYTF7_09225 [Planctomycetota bacterium]|jgi:hypothetical protein